MPAVNSTQALSEYLAMGPSRSLRRLGRHYDATLLDGAPSIETIKAWSGKFGWHKQAVEFDKTAEHRLIERTQTMVVSRNLNRVEALSLAADQCIEDALSIRIDGRGGSAQDKKALISAAIEATKLVEVLTGGVSDRTAKVAGMAQSAMAALTELEARARRRELQPPTIEAVAIGHTEKPIEPEPAEPREPSAPKRR